MKREKECRNSGLGGCCPDFFRGLFGGRFVVRSSSNFAEVFTTYSTTFRPEELSIGVPSCEFCVSEQSLTVNRGGVAQVSSKRDISLICRPIELKFGQNLLHSWFYDLTVRIVERKFQERDTPRTEDSSLCNPNSLVFLVDFACVAKMS